MNTSVGFCAGEANVVSINLAVWSCQASSGLRNNQPSRPDRHRPKGSGEFERADHGSVPGRRHSDPCAATDHQMPCVGRRGDELRIRASSSTTFAASERHSSSGLASSSVVLRTPWPRQRIDHARPLRPVRRAGDEHAANSLVRGPAVEGHRRDTFGGPSSSVLTPITTSRMVGHRRSSRPHVCTSCGGSETRTDRIRGATEYSEKAR